jgi:hypothetical protein
MTEESYSYRPKDPKSPGWRHHCNANGVPIAGTAIGIQGQQWVNCCVNTITASVNYKQKRGQDHHALINEIVDLWRSVCDGNQETATWFRTDVESWIEQFIITEDNNILTLMQSTIRYSLLRLYLASGTSMAENVQNAAIKAHIRRTNATVSDPEEDA